jgi:hypothetical protein
VINVVLKQTKRPHPKIKIPQIQPLPALLYANGDYVPNGDSVDSEDNKPVVAQLVSQLMVQPGDRADNKWLKYNTANRPLDEQSYDQPRFLHKTHFGFYVWPEEEPVYAPSSEQPKLDRKEEEEMPEAEEVIFRFFCKEENVNKLVEFLSLENKKAIITLMLRGLVCLRLCSEILETPSCLQFVRTLEACVRSQGVTPESCQ